MKIVIGERNSFQKVFTSAPKNIKRSSRDERVNADRMLTAPLIPPSFPLIFWAILSTSKMHVRSLIVYLYLHIKQILFHVHIHNFRIFRFND